MAGSESASITNEGTNTGQMVAQQNVFGKVARRTYWPLLTSKGISDTANRIFDWVSPFDFIVKKDEVLLFMNLVLGSGCWIHQHSGNGLMELLKCSGAMVSVGPPCKPLQNNY